MRRFVVGGMCLLMALWIAPGALHAGAEGRLSGAVLDDKGKGVSGAQVTLLMVDTEKQEVDETNKKGRFSFLVVDSTANFAIRIEKEGFVTVQETVDIQAGGTTRLEWVLTVGSSLEASASDTESAAPPKGSAAAVSAYNDAANAYNAGDRATAIAKFTEATTLDPTMAAGHKALAEVLLAEERFDDALQVSSRYLELAPDSPEAISLQYDILKGAGRAEEGLALLDQLIEKDPSPATAKRLFNLGLDASRKGDLEGALQSFTRALQVDPTLAQGYLGLADTHLRLGDYDEALAQAAKAEEVLPDNIGVKLVQYQAHRRSGDAAAADQAFASVRSANPERAAQVLFDEGKALFEANEPEQAMGLLEGVVEIDPGHADATYLLGLCMLNQNKTAEAKPLLERFLELAPDHPDAATAQEMLGALP